MGDPDGGENAVIIQPGKTWDIYTDLFGPGPSIYAYMSPKPGHPRIRIPCEYAVDLKLEQDPDVLDEHLSRSQGPAALDAYFRHLCEDKIGGTPAFLQGPKYPLGPSARLLLQLNQPPAAFSVNFGDAGVAYAFISEDGTMGKFLWQCA